MNRKNSILTRSHWVFDLDGTLTVPAHDFVAIRERLGIPPEDDILGFIDSRPEEERTRLRKILDEIEEEVCSGARPAHGVCHLMEVLRHRGATVGILTRNTRDIAIKTLAGIGIAEYFSSDAIIGRDEAAPKPDPEGLLRLAQAWQVPSCEMVMAGDYLFDLEAGKAAGAATVHVDQSAQFRWPHLADLAVENPGALAEMFSSCG